MHKRIFTKVIAMIVACLLFVGLVPNIVAANDYSAKLLVEKNFCAAPISVDIQPRSVSTAAVKKAIKWAIKHSDDLVKSAAKWIGQDAAKIVEAKFVEAVPILRTLLEYDDLVWQTIQDQLTHIVGREAAVWIRMALEWLL